MVQIDGIGESLRASEALRKETEAKRPVPRSRGDRVEISNDGYKLQNVVTEVQAAKRTLRGLPQVRGERVSAVQARIEKGYYHREGVVEKIADAILNSGLVEDMQRARRIVEQALSAAREVEPQSGDRLAEVQKRIKQGFYFQEKVYQVIADKLISVLEL